MYQAIEIFLAEFQEKTKQTIKLLQHLTPDSLSQPTIPKIRSIGALAWHLAGLKVPGIYRPSHEELDRMEMPVIQ
ncbi:MAG: hypothetical protein NZ108_02945 [Bacteroidia bacterium]|nr:hypothetical protein [Bacteroidia bacterium]